MKITSFYPMIVTKQADGIKDLFKELGFEIRHDVEGQTETDYKVVVMDDGQGHRVDVAEVPTDRDSLMIRMNVDNFDEAYNLLIEKGFVNTRGDGTVGTATSKAATMIAPSGFAISLIEHLK